MTNELLHKIVNDFHTSVSVASRANAQGEIEVRQPHVSPLAKVLERNYKFHGLYLDVYGYVDEEDRLAHVEDVTLAGSTISLFGFTDEALLVELEAALHSSRVTAKWEDAF